MCVTSNQYNYIHTLGTLVVQKAVELLIIFTIVPAITMYGRCLRANLIKWQMRCRPNSNQGIVTILEALVLKLKKTKWDAGKMTEFLLTSDNLSTVALQYYLTYFKIIQHFKCIVKLTSIVSECTMQNKYV